MSIEQIFNGLESLARLCHNQSITSKTKYAHDLWDDMDSIATEALALLKTHPDAQPNEPLTLEELREMDGQPVWLQCKYYSGWTFLTVHADGDIFVTTQTGEPYFIYILWVFNEGLCAKLYRRLPKED